ncbi:Type 3 secretion system secretin [subsurface metagenome]
MRNKAVALFIIILLLLSTNLAVAKNEKVSLNFDGVDINIFLKTMSEITGKSFVISEKIKGKISFVSSKDVPVERVYDIVLAILKVQGYFVVPKDDNIVYIYPVQEALKMSGSIYYGTEQLELEDHMIITQIIPLRYAGANEVLNVVKPLFTNEMLIIAYPRSNVIIANGQASKINLLQGMVYFLDIEIPQAHSEFNIYNLENSDAETMARTLSNLASSIPVQKKDKSVPQQTEGSGAFFSERFKVVANKETNSIIIISAPQDYEKIEKIIKELDVKREQVLVEALIVEITLNEGETLGFDWSALIDTGSGVSALAQSNTGLMTEAALTGGLPGLTVGLLNGTLPNVYAILNAQKANTNFKILSTPQIVTIDNYEATINVGEQIAFLTSSRVDENSNVIQTYDYKDIGISLKITPHINKNGYITLDIKQEVKKIVEGTSAFENPSVYNREINSRVTVKNERTIVLGGLIRDDMVTIEQKVPLLGDIPLLGLLFRKRTKQRLRTNLLIFITPHILTADTEIETVTEQKRVDQEAFENMDKDKKRKKRK